MQALQRRFSQSLFSKISWISRTLTTHTSSSLHPLTNSSNSFPPRGTLVTPWFAIQHRGAKVLGSDVRFGNVVQRKGRIYQVLKSQHTQQGRGGATIQVELRDVVTGNKVTERFRTDEAMETIAKRSILWSFALCRAIPAEVFVEEKSFTFLYGEGDSVTLMEPNTFEQIEISKELFGKAAAYLKDDMKVSLQMYDGKIMSASIPTRVTCTVSEAKSHVKGLTATPQYKRVLLDNGVTVLVPPFIEAGDEIIINTTDDSYITRAKE